MIHKFGLPFRIATGHKLGAMSYADGSGGPIALRTSPLASELPLTCEALPFAGGPSGPYLSACGGQLLSVRCAHYAGGASLSTFGFVTIVPRYLLPQVIPSHSFAALTALVVRRENGYGDQPSLVCASRRAIPKGVERAPASGTLPPARLTYFLLCAARQYNSGSGALPPIMRRQVWRWNSESPAWYPPEYPAIRIPCQQYGAAAATSPA